MCTTLVCKLIILYVSGLDFLNVHMSYLVLVTAENLFKISLNVDN